MFDYETPRIMELIIIKTNIFNKFYPFGELYITLKEFILIAIS